MNDRKRLGIRLRRARVKARLRQADVEKITGIGRYQLSSFEAGNRTPTTIQLRRLMRLYGIDLEYLAAPPKPHKYEHKVLVHNNRKRRS